MEGESIYSRVLRLWREYEDAWDRDDYLECSRIADEVMPLEREIKRLEAEEGAA